MNIYQKINEVRKKVAYVQKESNVGGKYKAVSHDAVTAIARDAMVEVGVITFPSLEESTVQLTGTETRNGAPIIRYEAKYRVSLVNDEDPSDKLEMVVEAHANDEGDKAPGKAVSYAVKYALLKVLMLETGEEDESRIEARRANKEELDAFGAEMREALEGGDFVKVGRSLIEDQEIWEAANQGTQRNGGQFDSKHKKMQSECTKSYVDGIKQWAAETDSFAESDQVDALMEIANDIDNPTDKKIYWHALSAKSQNIIKEQKAAS